MTPMTKLIQIVKGLGSPKFEDERQLIRFMDEILAIHEEVVAKRKVDRKLRRRVQRAWAHGLPLDLYQQIGLVSGLEARHIDLIINR
jgi:hypothetical protein